METDKNTQSTSLKELLKTKTFNLEQIQRLPDIIKFKFESENSGTILISSHKFIDTLFQKPLEERSNEPKYEDIEAKFKLTDNILNTDWFVSPNTPYEDYILSIQKPKIDGTKYILLQNTKIEIRKFELLYK